MHHLTESQLVQMAYHDSDPCDGQDWQTHLDSCSNCREKLARMIATMEILDDFGPPLGEISARSAGDLMAASHATNRFNEVATRTDQNRRWTFKVLAASLLMFVAGSSFMAGSIYTSFQSRNSRAPDKVDAGLKFENRIAARIEKQLEDFQERQIVISQQSTEVLRSTIGREFEELSFGQDRLRRELATLAINAEKEIMRTNQGLAELQMANLTQ